MSKNRKIETPDWVKFYICGEYHCDRCPYSWEERGEEDADAGCFLFGEIRDTCRYIRNPIAQMIVNKHKNEYESQWDGWYEYGRDYEICEQVYQEISDKIKSGDYVTDILKDFCETYDEYNAVQIMKEIVEKYSLIAHPYKTPKEKLKEAFSEWLSDFKWKHFKCYFRKEN